MKIAILYICTGKYTVFWKGFYESAEKLFLPNIEKHYFVFTDAQGIFGQGDDKIKLVNQENLGWPGNTLFRFHMFSRIKDRLREYDFIFFFNANMLFVRPIHEEFLPCKEGLLVTLHPGYFNKPRSVYPYENNPLSMAYIPPEKGEVYVCGGLNGGTSEAYLRLIDHIKAAVDTDSRNNITAVWHDESHLNRYILDVNYKLLDASYAYPEGVHLGLDKKIIIRDKNRFGGHDFLRGTGSKVSLVRRIRSFVRRVL